MNSPFTRLEIQPRNQSCGAWNRVSSSRLSSLEESPDRAASGCEELGASHESHLANLSWMAERGGHDAGGGARLPPGAEQRAQLLGRLWWAGPTPADGELLCSAAAATLGGGSTFHAEKLESCEEKTSPRRVGGGEARPSASLANGESANVMSLDFTHFTQLRQSLFTSPFVTRLFCRSWWAKNRVQFRFLVFGRYVN